MDHGALVLDFALPAHAGRVLTLMEKCSDLPMDFADAYLVVVMETFSDCQVVTLGRADFSTCRRHGRAVIPASFPD